MGDKVQIIISLIITLATTITAIFGWLKARRLSGESKALSSVVGLSEIYNELPNYIKEAEELFGSGFGVAKMSYVLLKAQSKCLSYSLPYNEDIIKTKVESILSTPQTKNANERTNATITNEPNTDRNNGSECGSITTN